MMTQSLERGWCGDGTWNRPRGPKTESTERFWLHPQRVRSKWRDVTMETLGLLQCQSHDGIQEVFLQDAWETVRSRDGLGFTSVPVKVSLLT